MVELNPIMWWRRLLSLPNESRTKTFAVAFLVAFFSAIAVSVTAVALRPIQQANLERQRTAQMEAMISALPGMADILREAGADTMESFLVDFATANTAANVNPASYNFRDAMTDPASSIALSRDVDTAGIGRRPNLMPVYMLRSKGELALVVLPVYGTGYQSTIHAYLALKGDLNTVAALQVYEQGETPGLGSRITDATWQALWPGRKITDDDGVIRISVVRGSATTVFEVDGITGATRSTTGVANLLHFWLGDLGYGPFLTRLKMRDLET
ncbi:NADH:ubiquinone reductase (Na(+)-transporting) subunit C [uncultured Maritalea sp.]|jgi:Na+-transporting NADH:ubiquinone oxidoreductase subunit C|uniref:NADH:ubiquinone reductase (Na(+)-transporting) subunit C n=1 Tax=uncultured Maritalea sp. TaxID=757249 RepID=UPI00260F1904|nr:NADH:ubiquinone reductase (Na(+)-transporting) subunit C [uncultured Maritalea sp.]